MTPYQGDAPNQPRGRQPSGNEYQQSPTRQPQQPPTGQFQGQSVPQGQQGQSVPQGQPQPMQQYQRSVPQSQPPRAQPQQQSSGVSPQMAAQGVQTQTHTGMQPQQQQQGGQPMTAGAQHGGPQPQQQNRPQMRPVRIEEIVQSDVVTAQRDTPIATVVTEMSEKDVGSVVVVEGDQPVGIITDREIALALETTPDIADKQAGDLLSGDLVTATTSMSIFDALQQLSDEAIRRLPIVDDNGTLQGIISLDDILVLLASELNKAGETIKGQVSRV